MSNPAYFQGRFVDVEEATVSIATHALNYGTGCFEGIRAYYNRDQDRLNILRMREHYERFVKSCRIMRIDPGKTVDEMCAITIELLQQVSYREDVYIRPLAFKADPVIKITLEGIRDAFGIFAVPLGDYLPTNGIRVMTSSWRRIDDNAIPARAKVTGSYVNTALSVADAHAAGFDDCILLTQEGHVSEGSSANLFLVRGGTLVTPPVSENILEGITRQVVMAMAQEEDLRVVERIVDRTELYVADEVFLAGTGVQVVPVVDIDSRPVGDGAMGPVTALLQNRYFDLARGKLERYRDWLTPVPRR